MKKISAIDSYLLQHWDDVADLREAIGDLDRKVAGYVRKIVAILKDKDWFTDELSVQLNPREGIPREIDVFKKRWKFGGDKSKFISIGVCGMNLDGLMGTGGDLPAAYVWVERLDDKDRKEFKRYFEKHAGQLRSALKIRKSDDEKHPLYYMLPQLPKQWVGIIESGTFVDAILKVFDTKLARFIDPVDRAFADLKKYKGGKVRSR